MRKSRVPRTGPLHTFPHELRERPIGDRPDEKQDDEIRELKIKKIKRTPPDLFSANEIYRIKSVIGLSFQLYFRFSVISLRTAIQHTRLRPAG